MPSAPLGCKYGGRRGCFLCIAIRRTVVACDLAMKGENARRTHCFLLRFSLASSRGLIILFFHIKLRRCVTGMPRFNLASNIVLFITFSFPCDRVEIPLNLIVGSDPLPRVERSVPLKNAFYVSVISFSLQLHFLSTNSKRSR